MRKIAIGVLVLALAAAAAVAFVEQRIRSPFRGYSAPEQFVEIPPGAGTRAIGDRLAAAGVVRDHLTFRAALWSSGRARRLKAGEYRFDRPMSALDVIDKLARGDIYVVNFTIPEGLSIRDVAALYETHGFGTAASFVQAAHDAALVQTLDPAARDLEGYLFPETYPLSRHTAGPEAGGADGRTIREGVHARAAQRCRGARFIGAPGGHAGVDRRERNRKAGRAAAGRRRLREPASNRHATPVRSDGDLRARQSAGDTQATSTKTICRSIRRTTRTGIRACRRGRLPRRARRRSKRPSTRPTRNFCILSAGTTDRTSSPGRSKSTTATC